MKTLNLVTFLFSLILSINFAFSQNLVLNPSFEEISACPDEYAQLDKAIGWTTPINHDGTPDLYSYCSSSPNVTLPLNTKGGLYPNTGDVLAGLFLYDNNQGEFREYIEVELSETLVKDREYEISFYYSLAETSKWSTNSFGVYLSDERVIGASSNTPLNVSPQIQNTAELDDMLGWTKLSFVYKAIGNEKHMILGNFNNNATTPITQHPLGKDFDYSYIYLDDVSIQKKKCDLTVDLGEDLSMCDDQRFTLDAKNEGAEFKWQDSSTSSTYEVTEPGIYWVEVSNGICTVTDEVLVEAIPVPDFSLGKDTTVCLGEPFDIVAKGPKKLYKWQDNSYSPAYTVTFPGEYWAEFDYECGTIRESVEVDEIDCNCTVYIPNTFTPNGDDINNEFSIVSSCDLEEFNLKIFNRWGDEIFESQHLSDAWIGDISDNSQLNGRYQYVVKYRFSDSSETTEVLGSILVMK